MQPAANTSASVPEQTIQPNNKKTGAFLGKIKNTATAIVAALGLVSSAEAAPSISFPVKISGSGLEQNEATKLGQSNIWSTKTISNGTLAETISEIVLTVSAVDAGPNGGILTISGFSRLITGVSSPTVGQGYANTSADINQEIRGGITGQTITVLDTFNGPGFTNDANRQFNGPGEGFDVSKPFSFDISVPAGGIEYRLQNVAQVLNADATVRLAGDINGSTPINLNFTANSAPPQPLDANKNSIPDVWEYDNFGMLTPANGDPDKDGMNNLVEYGFNTNPTVTNQSPVVCGSEVVNGKRYLCVTFPKNPGATNLNYTVESSNDLQTWGSDVIRVTTSTTQEKVRSIVPVDDSPRGFLRVKIETK